MKMLRADILKGGEPVRRGAAVERTKEKDRDSGQLRWAAYLREKAGHTFTIGEVYRLDFEDERFGDFAVTLVTDDAGGLCMIRLTGPEHLPSQTSTA